MFSVRSCTKNFDTVPKTCNREARLQTGYILANRTCFHYYSCLYCIAGTFPNHSVRLIFKKCWGPLSKHSLGRLNEVKKISEGTPPWLNEVMHWKEQPLHKKWSFPLRISSVNVTKSAACGVVQLKKTCSLNQRYWCKVLLEYCPGSSRSDISRTFYRKHRHWRFLVDFLGNFRNLLM